MPTTEAVVDVELLPLRIQTFQVMVRGITPVIHHRFSEKAKEQIEAKQQKKSKDAKPVRKPKAEFLASMYTFPGSKAGEKNAKYGLPALWFKQCAIAACSHVSGITKVLARGAFHIMDDEGGLVRLKSKAPRMREDAVRIGMGITDLRYRAEFSDWSCSLAIRYNASVITPGQIINLLNVGGFASGVGEMRPSQKCSGQYGMFEVVTS
jgi:hypothetical protein